MFRVLICDDAVAFSVLFKHWMASCDVDVLDPAGTAAEAVAAAGRDQPEVIVVDHLLPDATSAELVPRLRKVAPEASVLLISSMVGPELARAAADIGADAHISKAATPEQMRGAVCGLLREPGAAR